MTPSQGVAGPTSRHPYKILFVIQWDFPIEPFVVFRQFFMLKQPHVNNRLFRPSGMQTAWMGCRALSVRDIHESCK